MYFLYKQPTGNLLSNMGNYEDYEFLKHVFI